MKRLSFLWIYILFLPFLVYSQSDTSTVSLYSWKLTDGFLVEPVSFDTTINYVHIVNPIEHLSASNTWLGNLGDPWKSNLYFIGELDRRNDFIFKNNYRSYGFSIEDQRFYYSKTPYFDIDWTTSSKSRNENQLSALFTQNINKKINVGLVYKLISSTGEFPHTINSEHSFRFFTSYTDEKYSLHASFIRNKFRSEESWGIVENENYEPKLATPNSESASSVYYDRIIFLSQQYKFGFTKKIVIDDTTTESKFIELGRLNHVFTFNDNYWVYRDDDPTLGLYDSIYYPHTTITRDSIRLAKIENSLYWTFKEIKGSNFNGRLTVGAALENLKWKNMVMESEIDSIDDTDTIYTDFSSETFSDNYNNFKLMANLDARTKMFIFSVYGHYYLGTVFPNTNKKDNFEGNLLISKGIMIGKQKSDFYFRLRYLNNSPTIFEERYESNHYRWNKQFDNIGNTKATIGIKIPSLKFEGEFNYGVTTNYIYFDTTAIPIQYSGTLSVMAIDLKKDFKLGPFYSNNRVTFQMQIEGDPILNIPKFVAYHSFYWDIVKFLEDHGIEAQIGYEVSFTDEFEAYRYNPAIGQYCINSNRLTGYYPVLNAFLKLRIKTVLLFFKFEHLNNQFAGAGPDRYYFILDKYVMNTTAFKFGVSWRFKN